MTVHVVGDGADLALNVAAVALQVDADLALREAHGGGAELVALGLRGGELGFLVVSERDVVKVK